MPVDYDLVILGGAPEGRLAANRAAMTGARVALVEPEYLWSQTVFTHWLKQGLRQVVFSDWQRLKDWATLVSQSQNSQQSLAGLALQGVDVICGEGHFQSAPKMSSQDRKRPIFEVNDRCLTARGYLLATGRMARDPNLSEKDLYGLDLYRLLTAETLTQLKQLPRRLALLGYQGGTVEWATALAQCGVQVTLILETDRLLPAEDIDIQRLVRQQLLALGIRLVPQSQITQIKPLVVRDRQEGPQGEMRQGEMKQAELAERGVQIELIDDDILVDALVLTDAGPPNIESLALQHVGVSDTQRGVWTNTYLQTAHPRIYAAGSILGGEDRADIAAVELQVAIQNALFLNRRRIDYGTVAYGLWGPNQIGHVGLTERQACQIYGKTVETFQSSDVPVNAQSDYDLTFCKLITCDSGQLVGVHLLGVGARDLAVAMASQLQQPHSMDHLAMQNALPHTLATVVQQAAAQSLQSRWSIGRWQRDWAENWFNYRRSR